MSYTELTVWTRGIIMDKEGRDIVNSISASARIDYYEVLTRLEYELHGTHGLDTRHHHGQRGPRHRQFHLRFRPHRGQIRAGDGKLCRQSRSLQRSDAQILPRERCSS